MRSPKPPSTFKKDINQSHLLFARMRDRISPKEAIFAFVKGLLLKTVDEIATRAQSQEAERLVRLVLGLEHWENPQAPLQ